MSAGICLDKCIECGKSEAAHRGPLRCCPPPPMRGLPNDRPLTSRFKICENCGKRYDDHEEA